MKLIRRIAKHDFTENMMPQTRKEVFWDVVKLHWFNLFALALILLVAFLPVMILTVLSDTYDIRYMAELGENASTEAIQAARASIISFKSTSAFISIPCYMLFAAVLSGALRLMRQYVWEEVVFFWRDLWTGMKQNWKQTVTIAFVLGTQNAIGQYISGMSSLMQEPAIKIASGIFLGVTWILCFPIYACMLPPISVYSNTFRQNLKVGFILFAKSPLKTLLILLGVTLVFWVGLYPNMLVHLITQVAGVLLLPTALLIWFLFVMAQLDKYVNPIHFPELVGRGMYTNIEEKLEEEDLCK